MKEENQAIIKALNMYGRVPEQWELLKEIERLNKGLEYMEIYWHNREEYEKNELLRQIRDKDTSIEWLERAIEEEKKRERLY